MEAEYKTIFTPLEEKNNEKQALINIYDTIDLLSDRLKKMGKMTKKQKELLEKCDKTKTVVDYFINFKRIRHGQKIRGNKR